MTVNDDLLKEKARDYIVEAAIPDSLSGIIEFFDYGITDDEAISIYDLILNAKVEVSWDEDLA